MSTTVERALDDFLDVARLSGVELRAEDIVVDAMPAPHEPRQLPPGKQAVYLFALASMPHTVLKVGKAGPRSAARFTSQHYIPGSAQSNLAKSLLLHGPAVGIHEPSLTERTVGDWIRANTVRVDWYLPESVGPLVLNLLEAFLQARFRPAFEGALAAQIQGSGSLELPAAHAEAQARRSRHGETPRVDEGQQRDWWRFDAVRGPAFAKALERLIDEAEARGARHLDVNSGQLHRSVGGYPGPSHSMPTCCTVMREFMQSEDVIVAQPPSGFGASLTVRYTLPRSRTDRFGSPPPSR